MSSKEKDTENVEEKINNSNQQDQENIKENDENAKNDTHEDEILEKQNKNKNNKKMWKVSLALTIIIVTLVFSTIFALLNLGKNTIAKGVYIKGIDVSNLTIEEATNKINEAVNIELMVGIDLVYGEEYKFEFDTKQIQYTYDVSKAVKEAYNLGKSNNIIVNNYALLFTAFAGKDIKLESVYNEESLVGIVDDIASKMPGIVVQASYYIEDEELIIDKGKSGISIEKDKLKKDILTSIESRNVFEIINNNENQVIQIQAQMADPEPINIDKIYEEIYTQPKDAYFIAQPFQLFPEENGVDFAITVEEAKNIIESGDLEEYSIPLKFTPAQKTVDDIGTEAFPYLISSYTTKYDASNTNRSGNLKLAAEKINGTVLMPGEEFSFNEIVGKRTIEEGYRNAKMYENGQVVEGLAGGICQISSTLYNAVLLANLEITERRNHSYTSSYVPAGRDATVVYGTQDFKFKNTRTYPVKIEANVSNGIAEFKLHGIKEEIEYEIKIIPVTTQTIPYQTEFVPDATLMPGQQVVKQAGHSGYKVTTYIQKRLAGVEVSKDVLSNDTYKPMKRIINVGP